MSAKLLFLKLGSQHILFVIVVKIPKLKTFTFINRYKLLKTKEKL